MGTRLAGSAHRTGIDVGVAEPTRRRSLKAPEVVKQHAGLRCILELPGCQVIRAVAKQAVAKPRFGNLAELFYHRVQRSDRVAWLRQLQYHRVERGEPT